MPMRVGPKGHAFAKHPAGFIPVQEAAQRILPRELSPASPFEVRNQCFAADARLLIHREDPPQDVFQRLFVEIEFRPRRIRQGEMPRDAMFDDVGDSIPPRQLSGTHVGGGEKKNALDSMRPENRESQSIIVQVPVIKRNEGTGAMQGGPVIGGLHYIVERYQTSLFLEKSDLSIELIRCGRKHSGVVRGVVRVTNAVVIQDQQQIAFRESTEQPGQAQPIRPHGYFVAFSQTLLAHRVPTQEECRPLRAVAGQRRTSKISKIRRAAWPSQNAGNRLGRLPLRRTPRAASSTASGASPTS